ncbi:DUF1330 domain-containing protein [Nocardia bovistercoris]|uniref:DUF1330 domain-containing protein n=1 Tax=Nocardia bovistercoris TaxID=2785916 RepID=A0A931I887_9NOCA|nr:DUF1330 domain-containing protein [Nocardia bovistercoris]MBH0776742.1 DUF1330 domain-containing protein [Nocardia bovistercoris]
MTSTTSPLPFGLDTVERHRRSPSRRGGLARRDAAEGLEVFVRQATIVVEGVFRDGYEEHFAEYSRRVRGYLDRHGALVIRRQRVEKSLYGTTAIDLVMIIDLPSTEIAERIFFEPEYLALIPLRDKVFADFRMYLATYGDI